MRLVKVCHAQRFLVLGEQTGNESHELLGRGASNTIIEPLDR